MDPGNWATDLAGGAQFGYALLSVILLSSLMAVLLQTLSVRLGVATQMDLAQACRNYFSRPVNFGLWLLCEAAIVACDLAEVIGSAIALQLLFGLPLIVGVVVTVFDVLLLLLLQNRGFRWLESIVVVLIATIAVCFALELVFSRPDLTGALAGFVPHSEIVRNAGMLYIAVGILGATVMPHNLYLHSSIVQTRRIEQTTEKKREAIRFATIDSTVALSFALFINAAILMLAAAAFHFNGHQEVAEINEAYNLLSPLLGVSLASTLFAVALLASGQNSTLTGILAGQIVMEGFLQIRLKPWQRRIITRSLAIIPALLTIIIAGEKSTTSLLILSQVVLSLQLSFAVIPLVMFTSNQRMMKEFVNPTWLKILSWTIAIIIAGLNIWLLVQIFFSNK